MVKLEDTGTKIGFWASIAQSVIGYLYLIVYVVFVIIFPPKPWGGVQEFVSQYYGLYIILITIIQVLAFMQSFLFLIISIVINYYISKRKKIVADIGLYCSIIFTTLSSAQYYVQWTSVRLGISNNTIEGLGQLIQFNFDSPISVINILGWTFFFGISNIAFAFCFKRTSIGKWIKRGFLINGIFCLITSILFAIGMKSIMLIWTVFLVLTWYIYPLLAVSFRNGKMEIVNQ